MHKPRPRSLPFRLALGSLLAAVVFASNAATVNAEIDLYRLFKTDAYQQTSNAQPTSLNYSTGNVDVIFSNNADFAAAQVSSVSPLSPMTLSPTFAGFVSYDQTYATAAAHDTDFPDNTTYDYEISGGILGAQTASLSTPAGNIFASQVPFFNGNVYDQLQGMDSGNAFQFTFAGYAAPVGGNTPLTFFAIIRVSDGQIVYNNSGTNTQTSFVLPANTLQPGTAYFADLVYSSRIDTLDAGFSGATSEVGYDLRTDLTFTTAVPEPSTFILTALAGLALLVRRRKRIKLLSRANRWWALQD